jgi:general secretion pathway protein I
MSPTRQHGFTLLEVMVALAIVAIALSASIVTAGKAASDVGYLRDKTFAHWVAMNVISEMRASRQFPKTGRHEGSEILGGHEWFYVTNVELTQVPKIRRVDITIRAGEEDRAPVLDSLSTFYAVESTPQNQSPEIQP